MAVEQERGMIQTAGLYKKYEVRKADGSPVDPEGVYFVLRLDTDPYARVAAAAYASSCEIASPELAGDLLEYLRSRQQRTHRGLAHPDVTEADIRRLLLAARKIAKVAVDLGLDSIGFTWSFVEQLKAIVNRNACIKCGGRGYTMTEAAMGLHTSVRCDRCDGSGIR